MVLGITHGASAHHFANILACQQETTGLVLADRDHRLWSTLEQRGYVRRKLRAAGLLEAQQRNVALCSHGHDSGCVMR